jgi:transposase
LIEPLCLNLQFESPQVRTEPQELDKLKWGYMRKYETEFEFKVLKSFLDWDGGAKLPARQWSVPEEEIRTWVSHYSLHGIGWLRPKRSKCRAQFKLPVLSLRDREQLSSGQVEAVYDIRNLNPIVTWRRELETGEHQYEE